MPHEVTPENVESLVRPPINAVAHLPSVEITERQKERVYDGRPIEVGALDHLISDPEFDGEEPTRLVLIDTKQQLVAISSYTHEEGTAKPDMVFHDPPRD
jgi:tRNA U55 pseudouridine synthase TruB